MKKSDEKCYFIKLCAIDDPEIPVQGDKFGKYFSSTGGVFLNRGNIEELTTIMVRKPSRKNYVEEVTSGIEIPLVTLKIEKDDPVIVNTVLGSAKHLLFAFAIEKRDGITFQEDTKFKAQVATQEEVTDYISLHSNIHYHEELLDLLAMYRNKEREYLNQYKEIAKQQRFRWVKQLIQK